ncbi:MAG: HAD-IIIA family hydrolase [Prevotella sp.]|nr:HAD-IIIA family hydrolase [Prevotella sp.]MBR6137968.1 HAD-IIIA family hydrolase [Prevotella sp.]
MTKAIVFDLDGTLLDTLADLAASTNYALRSCGMPEHSIDDVRRFVGNGVRMLMTRAVPDGESNPRFDEAFSVFRQHYMQHCLDTTCPYPGIMDALARLKEKGMMLAIVSNKMQAATEELRQHFFSQYIDVAIGESAAIRKKPAPDTVNEALRLLGISHDEAIYVGDSDVDIDTARAAMMPCASVLWGFRDRQFLLNHGATRLLSSPEELLSLV